jgi:hypothetical protein
MKNASRKTEKLSWLRYKDGLMAKNPGIKETYPQAPGGLTWNRGGKVAANSLAGGTPRAANCLMLIIRSVINNWTYLSGDHIIYA